MLPNGQGWGIFIVPSNTNPSLGTIELRWKFTSGLSMPILSFPISINQWHHVYAGLRRNNSSPSTAMTVFALDGSGFLNMTASVSPTDTIATNAPLLIGGDGMYPGARIAIDEIEIFRRWLVSTEVKPIYEAGSSGKCKTKEAPDLAIEKKVTSLPTAGGFVNYQIKVMNVGTGPMPGPITVTDTFSSGLSFVSTGTGGGWSCTQSGGTLTCTHPGPVPAGGSLPIITVTASVAPNAEIVENCATVAGPMRKAPGGPAITLLVPIEGNLSNNKSCVKTDVKPGPKFDLMVNKEPVGQLLGGQNASYQIVVTNNGSAPASGPITVKDVLGSGLTYVTASGSGWTCTNAGQTVTCTHSGPVPANGALPPLTLTVTVGKGVTEVKNCATVKIVEQPPTKPGESWVFIPDASPDNDETCVTSPVTSHPIDPLPPCVTHPSNLIAWWPMDETNGLSSIVDIVGGHNGNTLAGALGSPNSPSAVPGNVGGGLIFINNQSYIQVPNSSVFNFGNGDFAIDAWVKPAQVGPTLFQPILEKSESLGGPGGWQGYRLYIKNGSLLFVLSDGTTQALVSAPITYNIWQLVAAQRVGNKLDVYVNGTLVNSVNLPTGFGSVSNSSDLFIGRTTLFTPSPHKQYIGEIAIDELEIFGRGLKDLEIKNIYNAGKAGKCKFKKRFDPN